MVDPIEVPGAEPTAPLPVGTNTNFWMQSSMDPVFYNVTFASNAVSTGGSSLNLYDPIYNPHIYMTTGTTSMPIADPQGLWNRWTGTAGLADSPETIERLEHQREIQRLAEEATMAQARERRARRAVAEDETRDLLDAAEARGWESLGYLLTEQQQAEVEQLSIIRVEKEDLGIPRTWVIEANRSPAGNIRLFMGTGLELLPEWRDPYLFFARHDEANVQGSYCVHPDSWVSESECWPNGRRKRLPWSDSYHSQLVGILFDEHHVAEVMNAGSYRNQYFRDELIRRLSAPNFTWEPYNCGPGVAVPQPAAQSDHQEQLNELVVEYERRQQNHFAIAG